MLHRESIYNSYQPGVTPEPENNKLGLWFVFYGNKLLVNGNGGAIPHLKSLDELGLTPVRTQYLGTLREYPCYSAEVSPDTAVPEGMDLSDLRGLYSLLDEDVFLLAGLAIQIVNWDQTHQYCGRCGGKTETLQGERAKTCPGCGFISYPRLTPAAITAVLKGDQILLSHNALFRGNMFSLIAGFVEPGETLEECIIREVFEEVSIKVKNIKYFGSQPWPFPNSLMIGFTAEYESGEIAVDGTEISEAHWYGVNTLPDLPGEMSIARKIIDWYIEKNSPNS